MGLSCTETVTESSSRYSHTHIRTRSRELKTAYRGSPIAPSGLRFYSPVIGRWLSRDPIAEVAQRRQIQQALPGGALLPPDRDIQALYAFVGNNPIHRTDYLGLTGCSDLIDNFMQLADSVNTWVYWPDFNQAWALSVRIACAYVPADLRWPLVVPGTCPNNYLTPSDTSGFCPQLSQGGQGADLFRHLGFNAAAKLGNTTPLSDWAESQDCEEVRESCGCCPVPSQFIGPPTLRCLEDQAEVIGDILGRRAGSILRRYMHEQVSHADARSQMQSLLCGSDCGQGVDHCCND